MTSERRQVLNKLMIRFADGDRSAFQPLFDGLWPALLSFTKRALPSSADAEDAAQQALLKVFARIVDFDRRRDGVSWAHGIAAFEVMTSKKQRLRRRESSLPAPEVGAEIPTPEDVVVRSELADLLRDTLGTLSPVDQQVLTPFMEEGEHSTGETNRKRRFRALSRLKDAWRKVYG